MDKRIKRKHKPMILDQTEKTHFAAVNRMAELIQGFGNLRPDERTSFTAVRCMAGEYKATFLISLPDSGNAGNKLGPRIVPIGLLDPFW